VSSSWFSSGLWDDLPLGEELVLECEGWRWLEAMKKTFCSGESADRSVEAASSKLLTLGDVVPERDLYVCPGWTGG
jgi:hypothetical protein